MLGPERFQLLRDGGGSLDGDGAVGCGERPGGAFGDGGGWCGDVNSPQESGNCS